MRQSKIINSSQWRPIYGYPGTFDPFTYGHLSVVTQMLRGDRNLQLEILVARNPEKKITYTIEERAWMIEQMLDRLPQSMRRRVRVAIVSGATVDYAYEQGIGFLIKGLRNAVDYQYEHDLATLNADVQARRRQHSVTTLYIDQVDDSLSNVSSSNLKLLGQLGMTLQNYAPAFDREILKMRQSGLLFIGAAGGIASGKTTFCEQIAIYAKKKQLPVYHISLDMIGRRIHEEIGNVSPRIQITRDLIADMFGTVVINPDGTIHRKNLAAIVFNDPNRLKQLTAVMMEPILFYMGQAIQQLNAGIVLIESATFLEYNLTELVDENMLIVSVPAEVQRERIAAKFTGEQVEHRLKHQMSYDQLLTGITTRQSKETLRLLLNFPGNSNFTPDDLEFFYQALLQEYQLRQHVQRTKYLFIPKFLVILDPKKFFMEIETNYNQHKLGYHNQLHIKEMLTNFETIKPQLGLDIATELAFYLAILLHDIIYDPAKKDNEAQSAVYADNFICRHVISPEIDIALVKRLIFATAGHFELQGSLTFLEQLILDLDKLILASPWPRLLDYETRIYTEYAPIYPRKIYIEKRSVILKRWLDQQTEGNPIFVSELIREGYEKTATVQLQRLINYLKLESESL
ncbi:pantetheine-phosphate adenylyltransferase [Gammaproteobacteria bacterium]